MDLSTNQNPISSSSTSSTSTNRSDGCCILRCQIENNSNETTRTTSLTTFTIARRSDFFLLFQQNLYGQIYQDISNRNQDISNRKCSYFDCISLACLSATSKKFNEILSVINIWLSQPQLSNQETLTIHIGPNIQGKDWKQVLKNQTQHQDLINSIDELTDTKARRICMQLYELGLSLNHPAYELAIAAGEQQHTDLLKLLISSHIDLDVPYNHVSSSERGDSISQYAIMRNKYHAIKEFIKLGIHLTRPWLLPPLHLAINLANRRQIDSRIVRLLANTLDRSCLEITPFDDTAIMSAAGHGNIKLVRMLKDIYQTKGINLFKGLSQRNRTEAFMLAVLVEDHQTAETLKIENPRILDKVGVHIVSSVIYQKTPESLKALIAAKANINVNHRDTTALIEAAWINYKAVMRILLEAGADVTAKSQDNTALSHALRINDQESIDLLIRAGADIDEELILATKRGELNIAKRLIEMGAKTAVEKQDNNE